MKILIISPTQKGIGGIAQHVQGFSTFLKNEGHNVDIMSSENTFTIPIKGLKNPSFMVSSFFKTLKKKEYDIVHAHNLPSALPMKNIHGKKVLSLQGSHSEQVELLHGNIAGDLSRKFEKNALKWADAVTVPSQEMYDFYTKLGYVVYYVPNAISITSLPNGKNRRFEKQIIFAGRLSKEKGILDVLEMSKKLPDNIHLLVLGSGPEEENVKKVFENKKNLHFLGYQSKEKTIELIRGSDILIQPSVMEGGISSTLLEAMACKTPIVATLVGGNKEVLSHMKTAFIINMQSPEEILSGVIELLSNQTKGTELAESAYGIAQKYDWSTVGKIYLEIYSKLLN